MAKIKYNNQELVNISNGQTVTLHTEGRTLSSDIEIEGYGEVPEGYVKPEGRLTITENNSTIGVQEYAEVQVATKNPYVVLTEADMQTFLDTSDVGSICLYVGATTDMYEDGVKYEVFIDDKNNKYFEKLSAGSGGSTFLLIGNAVGILPPVSTSLTTLNLTAFAMTSIANARTTE